MSMGSFNLCLRSMWRTWRCCSRHSEVTSAERHCSSICWKICRTRFHPQAHTKSYKHTQPSCLLTVYSNSAEEYFLFLYSLPVVSSFAGCRSDKRQHGGRAAGWGRPDVDPVGFSGPPSPLHTRNEEVQTWEIWNEHTHIWQCIMCVIICASALGLWCLLWWEMPHQCREELNLYIMLTEQVKMIVNY